MSESQYIGACISHLARQPRAYLTMGRKALSGREIWQDYSGKNAGVAENNFFNAFQQEFNGTNFRVRRSPPEFRNIYPGVLLTPEVLSEIYTPDREAWRHGVVPDYAIDNTASGKSLYVEVKRQDGWVEGKLRSAGRGNAHERSCKFFTPGLQKILRQHGRLGDGVLPFWTVFQGDITRDPCRVREITCWYEGCSDHFFMWRNSDRTSDALIEHFNTRLKHLLLP